MKKVFVSYAREDVQFAERLAKDLQDAGLDVWIDFHNIGGGQAWRDAIFKGISQAECLVVCLSPAAVESEWVRREILMARQPERSRAVYCTPTSRRDHSGWANAGGYHHAGGFF